MPLSITTSSASGSTSIDMSMAAGETVAQPVRFTPLDLTGYSLKMDVRMPIPLVLSTDNGGIAVVDAAAGRVEINIAGPASAAFRPGSYPYEFWAIGGGGQASRLWTGTFTVAASFTPIP